MPKRKYAGSQRHYSVDKRFRESLLSRIHTRAGCLVFSFGRDPAQQLMKKGEGYVHSILLRGQFSRFAFLFVLLVVTLCHEAASQAESIAGQTEDLRPFTVADSIESTHFVQPEEHSTEHPPASPDGDKFFVVTERGLLESNLREYVLLVYEFAHLSEPPQRLAIFRTSSNRSGIEQARWMDNNRISLIGENPGELPQVYVANCQNKQIRKLTAAPRGVGSYDISQDFRTVAYYAYWAPDEAEIKMKENHGFAVTDENAVDLADGQWKHPNAAYQMFLLNPSSGKVRPVKASPFMQNHGRLGIWLSPDGRYAVTCQPSLSIPEDWAMYDNLQVKRVAQDRIWRTNKIRQAIPEQMMLVDTQTDELRPLLNAPVYALPMAVWLNGHSVVVAGTFLPLDTNDPEELGRRKKNEAAVEVEIPGLAFRRIVDVSPYEEFWNNLRTGNSKGTIVFDLSQKQPSGSWKSAATRQYRKEGEQWVQNTAFVASDTGSQIQISEAPNCWPKLVRVDPATQSDTVVLDPNPQFKKLRFGREEILHWTGNLGQPLVGGLLYPPNYKPGTRYPIVIQSYQLKEDGFLLDGPATTAYAAQALVNHDVFVLQLSQSPLYPSTFATPEFGRTELSQIDSAVEYLDRLGLIDSHRVGLIGFSVKGFQVTYALAHSKYRFAAATSAEGNDWGYFSYVLEGNFPAWAEQSEGAYGGPPWNGNWKSWMQESITFNFDKIRTPLRLEADRGDEGSSVFEWEIFFALKRLHKPVELIVQFHGSHPVVRPWDRMTSQQGNVDWMMFWLKGEEDPDSAKAEQYARWRELKALEGS